VEAGDLDLALFVAAGRKYGKENEEEGYRKMPQSRAMENWKRS
jgi:hypothetical protein